MLPGWASVPLDADPIEVALPSPYRALYQLSDEELAAEQWLSRTFGATAVSFEEGPLEGNELPGQFVLEQPAVYGITLLDAFDLIRIRPCPWDVTEIPKTTTFDVGFTPPVTSVWELCVASETTTFAACVTPPAASPWEACFDTEEPGEPSWTPAHTPPKVC